MTFLCHTPIFRICVLKFDVWFQPDVRGGGLTKLYKTDMDKYLTLGLLMSYIYMERLFFMFLDHTQRRTRVGRTPLDEWSARRRDLYLTTHNTHNRQTSMPPGGIRTHDLSRRTAADLRLRPRGHWDRQRVLYMKTNIYIFFFLSYLAHFFLEWEMFQRKAVKKK